MRTDTLIVGGGLCGLALADALEAKGQDYLLVEARSRFGGRILSEYHKGAGFDLGPAWFWPGQPLMANLVQRLGLKQFDQYADGILSFEDERGQVQRGRGFSSMQGSWRVQGGLGTLSDGLARHLPSGRTRLNTAVEGLRQIPHGVSVRLSSGDTVQANQVVLALPPRISAGIEFDPPLPPGALAALHAVPTWMAGQAKAVAVYSTAFWREEGLSGDAMSRFGPMVEIHDASPSTDGLFALFGFIGVLPQARRDEQVLRQQVLAQLVRLFGAQAAEPEALFIKDWACDPFTAVMADQAPVMAHPQYGMPWGLENLWDGRVILAGTEVATEFGGYLEGALEAAELALGKLSE